jgi:hypothetical protein
MVTMTTTPVPGGSAQVTRMGVSADSNRIDQNVDPSGVPANMVATYDAVGNVVSTPTASFEYDALDVVNESTTDQRRLYLYTASDERVASIESSTGTEFWTIRDPGNRVLRRFTRSGGTTKTTSTAPAGDIPLSLGPSASVVGVITGAGLEARMVADSRGSIGVRVSAIGRVGVGGSVSAGVVEGVEANSAIKRGTQVNGH